MVTSGNVDRALGVYGAKLGLDLRLDRENPQWNARQLFFRCGDAVFEMAAKAGEPDLEALAKPDRFGGLAWRVTDPDAAQARIAAAGFNVSEVRVGRNTTLPLGLTPAVEETITVTSESPLLDERKLQQGTTVSQVELEKIPTARDPWALLNQTPGVMVDRINVGGNESGQQAMFRAPGVSPDENDFLVDGVQITDMRATGASSTYYDFDQFAEMQFTTGGTDVTKNAAGVSVNLVTKRGSNEFRGSGRFYNTKASGYFGGGLDQSQPNVTADDLGNSSLCSNCATQFSGVWKRSATWTWCPRRTSWSPCHGSWRCPRDGWHSTSTTIP